MGNKDEHSEKVQEIMKQKPSFIVYWGNLFLFFFIVIVIILLYFFKNELDGIGLSL